MVCGCSCSSSSSLSLPTRSLSVSNHLVKKTLTESSRHGVSRLDRVSSLRLSWSWWWCLVVDDRCRSCSLHVEKEEKKTYLRLETYCVSSLVLMMVCGGRLMSSFSFPTRSLRTLSVSSHLIIVRKKKLTGCVSNLRVRLSWFPHTVNSCRHSHHSRSPQVVVSSSSR